MKWELAIIAATVLSVAAVSRRLAGTSVTPAMVFVVVGVLVGPLVFDEVTAAPTGEGVRTLAEASLAVVLFAPSLSTSGETLTIEESMNLEGENGERRDVGEEHEWSWSCVPLLLIALAAADVQDKAASCHHAIRIVAEQIGYGILGGMAPPPPPPSSRSPIGES